ncbi:hypothetical protein GCM10020229_15550 [Kitasatospora albolonga]
MLAAARALATTVADDQLNPNYIIPSVFHPDVAKDRRGRRPGGRAGRPRRDRAGPGPAHPGHRRHPGHHVVPGRSALIQPQLGGVAGPVRTSRAEGPAVGRPPYPSPLARTLATQGEGACLACRWQGVR